MRIQILFSSAAAFLAIFLMCMSSTISAAEKICGYRAEATVEITAKGLKKSFRTGIADTPEKHQRGLQECPMLEKGTGLLFIFPTNRITGFWMDKTYIPLRIIFIAEDGTVISNHEGIPLNKETVGPGVPVRYVLEVHKDEGADIPKGAKATFHFK